MMSFFCQKKPRQELEVGPRSGPYLLVIFNIPILLLPFEPGGRKCSFHQPPASNTPSRRKDHFFFPALIIFSVGQQIIQSFHFVPKTFILLRWLGHKAKRDEHNAANSIFLKSQNNYPDVDSSLNPIGFLFSRSNPNRRRNKSLSPTVLVYVVLIKQVMHDLKQKICMGPGSLLLQVGYVYL